MTHEDADNDLAQYEELQLAKQCLARADKLVSKQEHKISLLRVAGRDTRVAQIFLRTLMETREVVKRHLEHVEAEAEPRSSLKTGPWT